MKPDYPFLATLCGQAYRHDDFELDGGTQGIIVRIGGVNIVAIRGTERDYKDIFTDIRAVPWWSGELGHFCHKGFLLAAREVVPIVQDLAGPTVLTGHSLGGAIARIAGGIIDHQGAVVTYGEPRSIFGRMDKPNHPYSRRFVNGIDCVPDHPWPIWGYRHQVPVDAVGKRLGDDRFEDHKISNYCQLRYT